MFHLADFISVSWYNQKIMFRNEEVQQQSRDQVQWLSRQVPFPVRGQNLIDYTQDATEEDAVYHFAYVEEHMYHTVAPNGFCAVVVAMLLVKHDTAAASGCFQLHPGSPSVNNMDVLKFVKNLIQCYNGFEPERIRSLVESDVLKKLQAMQVCLNRRKDEYNDGNSSTLNNNSNTFISLLDIFRLLGYHLTSSGTVVKLDHYNVALFREFVQEDDVHAPAPKQFMQDNAPQNAILVYTKRKGNWNSLDTGKPCVAVVWHDNHFFFKAVNGRIPHEWCTIAEVLKHPPTTFSNCLAHNSEERFGHSSLLLSCK